MAERSTIIKPCKAIMNYSIQQVMTVQNEKDNKNLLILRIPTIMPRIQTGVVSVILPKGFITLNTSLSAKMTQKLIYKCHFTFNFSSNICRAAVPYFQSRVTFYQIRVDTSDENRSWRPASSGKDRYLSVDILDLPFLSPLRHPMVDNGLGCLEE